MKAKREFNWIGEGDFKDQNPLVVEITDVLEEKGKYEGKMDHILYFKSEAGIFKCMSVWGSNWNLLIDSFGDETDLWNGKTIKIEQSITPEGKNIRSIQI